MHIKLIDNPVKLAEFLNNPANTGNIVDSGDKYYIKPDAVYLGIYEGLVLAGVHEVRNFWHSVECAEKCRSGCCCPSCLTSTDNLGAAD
jgi:hypothetical protein